jgi:hypothetical protein
LLAICVLGFIGLININAIADNKKAANSEFAVAKAEILNSETMMTDMAFLNEAKITAMEADAQIGKYASKQISLIRNSKVNSEFLKSAESITADGADLEIEKYAKKLVSLEKTKNRE